MCHILLSTPSFSEPTLSNPPRTSGSSDPQDYLIPKIPGLRIHVPPNSPSLNSGTPGSSNCPDASFPNLKQSQNPRSGDSDPRTAQACISSRAPRILRPGFPRPPDLQLSQTQSSGPANFSDPQLARLCRPLQTLPHLQTRLDT